MVDKVVTRVEEGIIALLLVGMTLLVFIEVVLRFGFNTSIHWAEEMTLLIAGWFVLFGASYGVKVGAHIGVDAVVRLLSPGPRRIVSLIAVSGCLIYCGLFIFGSWEYVAKVWQISTTTEDIRIPMVIAKMVPESILWDVLKIDIEDPLAPQWATDSIMLIGYTLLGFRFLQLGWSFVTGKATGFHFADEAEEALEELAIHDEAELHAAEKAAEEARKGEAK